MKQRMITSLLCASTIAAMLAGNVFAAESAAAPSVSSAAEGYSLSYQNPIVTVEGGQLLGMQKEGVYEFRGIQYAKAERFEMPQKPDAWEGIQPALTYGEVCPVSELTNVEDSEFFRNGPMGQVIENETCQFMNVWSIDLSETAKKPVMIFLHGGGFSSGSSIESVSQDLGSMAQFGDVVTVSINHRLNVLGFLDLSDYGEEYKYSGNAGMADIVMALQWIHDNIAQFGGDPENVTIFGQSGGGSKVATLLGMPEAQGLFQKAIIESGGISGNSQEDAKKVAAKTMEILGVTTVEELQQIDYDSLITGGTQAISALNEAGEIGRYSWGPVIDGDYYPEASDTENGFTKLANDIPLIIGTTFGEFGSNGQGLVNNWGPQFDISGLTEEDVLARLQESYGESAQTIMDAFKAAYPDHPVADVLYMNCRAWSKEQLANFPAGFSALFAAGSTIALSKASTNDAPVYSFVFAYDYPMFGGTTATHGAELAFVFHNADLFDNLTLGDPAAYNLQDVICRAWTNFAHTGDPSQDGLAWEPLTEESGATMIFDVNSEVRYFHDKDLMQAIADASAAMAK